MASGYSAKRFEENRGYRKLCHLNPFEFFDHTSYFRRMGSASPKIGPRACAGPSRQTEVLERRAGEPATDVGLDDQFENSNV